jgi:hypothetical protein
MEDGNGVCYNYNKYCNIIYKIDDVFTILSAMHEDNLVNMRDRIEDNIIKVIKIGVYNF